MMTRAQKIIYIKRETTLYLSEGDRSASWVTLPPCNQGQKCWIYIDVLTSIACFAIAYQFVFTVAGCVLTIRKPLTVVIRFAWDTSGCWEQIWSKMSPKDLVE